MTLSPDDRDALAELAAAGDRDAASAAIEAVRPLVVGRSRVPRRDRAEAADDALAEVALRISDYDRRKANFATFAASVAYWHVRNWGRRRGPRCCSLSSPAAGFKGGVELAALVADDGPDDLSQVVADRIDAAVAWACLDALPAVQRHAVAGWARGVNDDDLAAERGVTAGAVQQARTRGLAALRLAVGA